MSNNKILKRILILDDDADLRKLLLAYLGKQFTDVELVEYDPVARGVPNQDFDWAAYDVLILDYYLSIVGITGLDILHANRKNPAFPAVIMLTGAGNEEIAVRALKAGVYDYLRKQSLDKQTLHNSIVNAFQKHQVEKQRLSELTQQGHAFNKAIFYQQLEYKHGDPEYRDRVFYLIELDNHALIEEHAGIILRDNIVRHIAKQSYEILKLNKCSPGITRLGDYYIALLIDAPVSRSALESGLLMLTGHLHNKPYRFGNTEFPFTISIGVVSLTGRGQSADEIIRTAKQACVIASHDKNNSYHISSSEDIPPTAIPESADVRQKSISPVANKPAMATKPDSAGTEKIPATVPAGNILPTEVASRQVPTITPRPSGVPPASTVSPQQPRSVSPDPGQASVAAIADTNEHELKLAFEEKRVIQVYQPVISLMNEEVDPENEIHRVFLQHIFKDGSIKTGDAVKSQINAPDFRKYVDRWLLREVIGKITNADKHHYSFIVDISDASLADAGFFTWLRKLLTGLDSKNPGRYLLLEINISDLAMLEKQTNALITYLRKSHEFRFVLGGINDARHVIDYTSRIKFDLVVCSHTILQELEQMPGSTPAGSDSSVMEMIRSKGTRFIADDVEDASVLTEVIGQGIEYATGSFIGEATDQLNDETNIESYEIV